MSSTTLIRFVRRLRDEGIPVGPTVVDDLTRAVEVVGLASAEDTYHAFRSISIASVEHIPAFDRVFMETFGRTGPETGLSLVRERTRSWSIEAAEGGEGEGESDQVAAIGASWDERLAHKDFADLSSAEAARVKAMIAAMMWQPALTPARRRRPTATGDRPDPRRMLRRMVRPEGELLLPSYTQRRIRRRPLIFIADVSGSMERYSEMLLYFAHAARGRLGRLEAFVFSTRLTRITHQLERRSPGEAISRVSSVVEDWSGGTRIGEALGEFNRRWARRVTTGGPIVLIVSDGWDRGEPARLSDEMARLSRTVHRIVWLNPLASRAGYSPETRGMQAALPFIDDLLAAGRFDDLATVVDLLESVPVRKVR